MHQAGIPMTQSTHKINSSDLLHTLVLTKYLKHHKTSFRKKCLDTFPAHRRSIMVLTVITKGIPHLNSDETPTRQTLSLFSIGKYPLDTQALKISSLLLRNDFGTTSPSFPLLKDWRGKERQSLFHRCFALFRVTEASTGILGHKYIFGYL